MTTGQRLKKDGTPDMRSNSGRKPVADKRVRVDVYVNESIIIACGGLVECQRIASEYLIDTANNKKDKK